jgi:hypothetical protein
MLIAMVVLFLEWIRLFRPGDAVLGVCSLLYGRTSATLRKFSRRVFPGAFSTALRQSLDASFLAFAKPLGFP